MKNYLRIAKLISITGIFLMLFLRFSLIPYFIGTLVLCSLFTIDYKKTDREGLKHAILLGGLFFINVISLFYSSNFNEGIKTIESQLSLLLLPFLIYFDQNFYREERDKIKILFVASSVISIITLLIIFIFSGKLIELINFDRQYDVFMIVRYLNITIDQHPSYISLGYLLASIIIWQSFKTTTNKAYLILKVTIILFILAFIFLLNARAIFIATFFVVVYFAIKYLTEHRLIYKIIIITVLAIGFVFLVKNTRFKKVFQNFSNATNIEQVDLRFSLWYNAIIAWQEKPLFGYGIGDSKEALARIHKQRDIEEAVEYKYNAHNQFFETLLQTGLVGFVILMLVFTVPFYQSIRKQQELLFLFLMICFVCFIFESMFQRITGIVFFAFWYSFLVVINLNENKKMAVIESDK
ncbi:MAG: O-antigen ligase family protein [Bacteroidales bacterium]